MTGEPTADQREPAAPSPEIGTADHERRRLTARGVDESAALLDQEREPVLDRLAALLHATKPRL